MAFFTGDALILKQAYEKCRVQVNKMPWTGKKGLNMTRNLDCQLFKGRIQDLRLLTIQMQDTREWVSPRLLAMKPKDTRNIGNLSTTGYEKIGYKMFKVLWQKYCHQKLNCHICAFFVKMLVNVCAHNYHCKRGCLF